MHSITSVYIDMPARQEHRHVSAPWPTVAVACRVGVVVSLDLDQTTADSTHIQLRSYEKRGSFDCRQHENLAEPLVHSPFYRNLQAVGASTQ